MLAPLLACQQTAPSSCVEDREAKDPSELTHRDSQNEIDDLPASCSRHTRSEQQQVPPPLQTKGSRFAVNSLPGRKTFSSKETIYLE